VKGSQTQEAALSNLDLPIQSRVSLLPGKYFNHQVSAFSEVDCSWINILEIVSNYLSLIALQKNVLNLIFSVRQNFCLSGNLRFGNFFCISQLCLKKAIL